MSMIGNMMPLPGWKPEPSDRENLAAMTIQRDELLAALKLAVQTLGDLSYRLDVRVDHTYCIAQTAIAKAEGR